MDSMSPEELFKGLRRFETDENLKKKILFLVEEWKRMFPLINIQEQIQLAHYWLVCHGVYRKRHDLYLSNWMKKAEEIRQTKPVFGQVIPVKKYVENRPKEEDLMTADDFAKLRQTIRGGSHDSKRDDAGSVPQE